MDKTDVISFFNSCAPKWDAETVRNDETIAAILDKADIRAGVTVLDVACGTGVLLPDYLARGVASVVGIDISPEMIQIAKSKFRQSNVTFVCGDVEEAQFDARFDRAVVYNAFPHFPKPERLIAALAEKLASGGRLTVAHGAGREHINRHHSGEASKVSVPLMSAEELTALFEPYFKADVKISEENIYIVSGVKR